MKKIILFAALLVSFSAIAQIRYVAARSGLSLREKQDAGSTALVKIPFGAKITVQQTMEDRVSVEAEGMKGSWVKATYNGKTGFVNDLYLFSWPVPKATVQDLKGYITQLAQPFGTKLVVKRGSMMNIEESGYELRKQLYKNGAEIHELIGYEYGSTTYFIPDFDLQQGFLLLRMIPEFKEIFGAQETFPTESKTYKKGEIEYTVTVDKQDFGDGNFWYNKITIEYSEGASFQFEMFYQDSQLVVSLSSGV